MKVKINIIEKQEVAIEGVLSIWGQITIGNFKESVPIGLEYWSRNDFERQWKEGLERLQNYDKSCLVTYVQDPKTGPYIDWWPMYKIDNKVYVQNHILFADLYRNRIGDKQFTPDTCYDFIPNRKPKEKVSEWVVDLE
ncbi:hypothetical protein H0X48_05765 [Candidatus Dependentiae bacterium]|nr:hypothetical protein [Candidatus Dependentiae bacterium]